MNPVQQALANARAQEQRQEAAVLTAAVASRLGVTLAKPDTSEWKTWAAWCQAQRVEAYPALPASIAVWILNHAGLGVDRLEKVVEAISAAHAPGADPTASPLVSAALNQVAPIEAPHSFPKEQKAQFTRLPRDLQKFVAEHTRKIVTEMRRAQNKAAKDKSNGTIQQAAKIA
jgi:hypothetical protein